MRHLISLAALACVVAGCARPIGTTPMDPDRILHMAGEEAGQVAAPLDRLTRQLNIANRQTESGHAGDARRTLGEARKTLEGAEPGALSDHQRLAGWISLCELAREAGDAAFANAALDRALAGLEAVTPQQARCEYVLGIERELHLLRGDGPAIKLLVTASDWAMELPDQRTRRSAFFAFTEELFRRNDYEAARAVLRKDADAAWRSDTLAAISEHARSMKGSSSWGWPSSGGIGYAAAVTPGAAADVLSPATGPTGSFGKRLDFRSNYFRSGR